MDRNKNDDGNGFRPLFGVLLQAAKGPAAVYSLIWSTRCATPTLSRTAEFGMDRRGLRTHRRKDPTAVRRYIVQYAAVPARRYRRQADAFRSPAERKRKDGVT